MNIPFEKIIPFCEDFITLDSDKKSQLTKYAELLVEWNEKINLTAITEPEEIAVKHFLDCIMIFKYVDISQNSSVIDIGTGAGFPGLVMKIVRPDINLTLLDSLNKRITFLDTVCSELSLKNVTTIHSRAEDGAVKLREKYDYAVARAVANMPVLCEYCIPYVKLGGSFVAMKGASAKQEAEQSVNAVKILGGQIISTDLFNIENCGDRGIISIKKISQTPTKYPRNPAKISKQPL